jgi:hypothetical protein
MDADVNKFHLGCDGLTPYKHTEKNRRDYNNGACDAVRTVGRFELLRSVLIHSVSDLSCRGSFPAHTGSAMAISFPSLLGPRASAGARRR